MPLTVGTDTYESLADIQTWNTAGVSYNKIAFLEDRVAPEKQKTLTACLKINKESIHKRGVL